MKLTRFTPAALFALATSISLHAGTEMTTDHKDMKQMSHTEYASDAGFYVAAYGGVNFLTDYGNNHTSFSGLGDSTPGSVHSDVSAVGGVKGGYNFESFPACDGLRLQPAVELEGMYISMRSKADHALGVTGVGFHDTTSWNNAAGFVNGIIRFKLTDSGSLFSRVTPYLGVGAGVEYLTTHTHLSAVGANLGNAGDEDVVFAAQALAGVDFALNKHWSLFTEYKFIDALGAELESPLAPGISYRFAPNEIKQNLATVGVKYNF